MKTQDYAVIGLGKFGEAVIDTLIKLGKSVLAIDLDEAKVNKIAPKVKYAVTLDSTDIESLEGVGITKFENVIIAMSNIEASIMTAVVLKELKITNIMAKASSSRHARVLQSIGILSVVRPEVDAARKTALHSVYRLAMDVTDLSNTHSLIKVICNNPELKEKTLQELDTLKEGISIACIEREGVILLPKGDTRIEMGDIVTFVADNKRIRNFYQLLAGNVTAVDAWRWEKTYERQIEQQISQARKEFAKEKDDNH